MDELAKRTEDRRIIREFHRLSRESITPEVEQRCREARLRHRAQTRRMAALFFGIVSFKEAMRERPFRLVDYVVFAWVACLLMVFGLSVARHVRGPVAYTARAERGR